MSENNNKNGLSELLIKLRTKKNMTQKELAEKLNVSDKTISRWETGGNLPDMEILYSISKFFKVSMNDLAMLRISAKEGNDEIVEEMIKDFTKKDKQKQRLIKIISVVALSIIVFLIGVFIFSMSYNRFKVYNVNIISNDIYPNDGVYVETKIKDSLFLKNIVLRNYTVKKDDNVSVELYYLENDKENILYSFSSLNNIKFVDYDSYIKIDNLSSYFDNLYIKVIVINSKGEEKSFTGKLKFILDFSNNKIYSNDKKTVKKYFTDLTPEEIKEILLNNGYEENAEYVISKKTKEDICYYIQNLNKFNYSFVDSKYNVKYSYELNKNILYVSIFNDNNIEIENYSYDVTNDKIINCYVGKCNGYKEALDILNKEVLYLLNK